MYQNMIHFMIDDSISVLLPLRASSRASILILWSPWFDLLSAFLNHDLPQSRLTFIHSSETWGNTFFSKSTDLLPTIHYASRDSESARLLFSSCGLELWWDRCSWSWGSSPVEEVGSMLWVLLVASSVDLKEKKGKGGWIWYPFFHSAGQANFSSLGTWNEDAPST
jgi:hypothetical protein